MGIAQFVSLKSFFFNVSRTDSALTKWSPRTLPTLMGTGKGSHEGDVDKLWHTREFCASKLNPLVDLLS